MNWKLPNQLTVARIGLAGAFFVLLGLYESSSPNGVALLNVALGIYLVAGITDVLDGWIALRYNWTSAFGRITDPFVDKVLVVGAFAMLTGSNFVMPAGSWEINHKLPHWLHGDMATAVQAWMVVVVLAREFIVSAVRGYSESQGIKFPATSAGKIKMFLQSVAICFILIQLANFPGQLWAVWVKIVLVWLSVLVTVLSGFTYVTSARKLLVSDEK